MENISIFNTFKDNAFSRYIYIEPSITQAQTPRNQRSQEPEESLSSLPYFMTGWKNDR